MLDAVIFARLDQRAQTRWDLVTVKVQFNLELNVSLKLCLSSYNGKKLRSLWLGDKINPGYPWQLLCFS